MGGTVETNQTVTDVRRDDEMFHLTTDDDQFRAEQVVSTVPITLTKRIAADIVGDRLDDDAEMVREHEGGAVVVFLGVPEADVNGREITHHQILDSYHDPLGDGNNMFVSVSAPADDVSAPEGYRAVILSTHTSLEQWRELDDATYERRKRAIGKRLIEGARMVYPELATNPRVYQVGTPVTYELFTNLPRGAIGGYRQTVANTNQRGVPKISASTGSTSQGTPHGQDSARLPVSKGARLPPNTFVTTEAVLNSTEAHL
jgi:phytoene dehydrogenase-like protein